MANACGGSLLDMSKRSSGVRTKRSLQRQLFEDRALSDRVTTAFSSRSQQTFAEPCDVHDQLEISSSWLPFHAHWDSSKEGSRRRTILTLCQDATNPCLPLFPATQRKKLFRRNLLLPAQDF